MTREEQVAEIMQRTGVDEIEANFIAAIENDEIEGDIIDLAQEPLPEA